MALSGSLFSRRMGTPHPREEVVVEVVTANFGTAVEAVPMLINRSLLGMKVARKDPKVVIEGEEEEVVSGVGVVGEEEAEVKVGEEEEDSEVVGLVGALGTAKTSPRASRKTR